MKNYGYIGFEEVGNQIFVVCYSPLSGKHKFEITEDKKERIVSWSRGSGLIQDVLSDMTDDEREMLLSGITPDEWEEYIPSEED